jgi:hypothetical protein
MMIEVKIVNRWCAVRDFNNELNNYYQSQIADDRPYAGDDAMESYLGALETSLNDETDLTWEIGTYTRDGYVAEFSPTEDWKKTYLRLVEGE